MGFSSLPMKYKITALVFLGNVIVVTGAWLGLQKLALTETAMQDFYQTQFVTALLSIGFSLWVGSRISRSIENLIGELDKNTSSLDEVATKIAAGSTQLSSATTEQSSALQETVATIDQIAAMIHKNSEAAQKSKEHSIGSKDSAEQGSQIVDDMMRAINAIEANNTDMSQQMHDSNKQLAEITKLIHEISTKTQIINDIVFQTKLLSFNAAVEAARAGEYGYGFSVVAEEIGKLAQRSGGAAKEITNMLQDSVGRVEFIIDDTKNKVDKIMVASKEKINFGSEKTKRCKDALNEILISVKSVDKLVLDIAAASKEQSVGVGQISHAINQLESVTSQNSSVAQASATAGEQLRHQASSINNIVKNLNMYIGGTTEVKPAKAGTLTEKLATTNKKVLAFDRKKTLQSAQKAFTFDAKKHVPAEPREPFVLKKVSGYEGKMPSGDDPGFKE